MDEQIKEYKIENSQYITMMPATVIIFNNTTFFVFSDVHFYFIFLEKKNTKSFSLKTFILFMLNTY